MVNTAFRNKSPQCGKYHRMPHELIILPLDGKNAKPLLHLVAKLQILKLTIFDLICLSMLQNRVSDVNAQAEKFMKEDHFDIVNIQQKQAIINQRYMQ